MLCEALPRTGKEKEKHSGNSIAYAGRVTAAKAERIRLKTDPHKTSVKNRDTSSTEGATAGFMGEGGTGVCIMMMDVKKKIKII